MRSAQDDPKAMFQNLRTLVLKTSESVLFLKEVCFNRELTWV